MLKSPSRGRGSLISVPTVTNRSISQHGLPFCFCSKRLIRCFERGANPAVQRLFPQFLHKSPRANAIAYQSFQDVTWKTIFGLTGRSDALQDSALRHVSKSQSQLGPGFFMQPLVSSGVVLPFLTSLWAACPDGLVHSHLTS